MGNTHARASEMRAKWSRPYAETRYSSTSGCHRRLGLNVYRSIAVAAGGGGAAGEAEESIKTRGLVLASEREPFRLRKEAVCACGKPQVRGSGG